MARRDNDISDAVISALNTAAHVADLVTLASAADEKAFEGFYTDPENHPGGSRKITVDDGTIGVFRQAWIDGGGGEGEPANYTLPALVKGDRIIADFSVPPNPAHVRSVQGQAHGAGHRVGGRQRLALWRPQAPGLVDKTLY